MRSGSTPPHSRCSRGTVCLRWRRDRAGSPADPRKGAAAPSILGRADRFPVAEAYTAGLRVGFGEDEVHGFAASDIEEPDAARCILEIASSTRVVALHHVKGGRGEQSQELGEPSLEVRVGRGKARSEERRVGKERSSRSRAYGGK